VYLQEEIRQEHNFEEMVGGSPALQALLHKLTRVAQTDATVLICGETGTGKELIARALHNSGARKQRPLVKVNCGAVPASLIESELFGHVKGAFTGALERRVGRFELANGGTLFLDEVGEMPLETQVKLLRVLQEQEFEPVGSSKTVRVDVRIIAATNRDLSAEVRAGRFRSDLYFRLNVVPLNVPPLRARQSDIPLLVSYFLSNFAKKFGRKIEGVTRDTMDLLTRYEWPGNIRELQNVMERAVVLTAGPLLALDEDLLPKAERAGSTDTPPSATGFQTLEDTERHYIEAVLAETHGVVEGPSGAARILGLHPNTLRSRMKKLGIGRQLRHEIS
jgi:formate hydrogenlyase transcriptional activator